MPGTPIENRLLSALPREEYERLAPHLKEVSLPQSQVLWHPGESIRYVYFPNHCMISLLTIV